MCEMCPNPQKTIFWRAQPSPWTTTEPTKKRRREGRERLLLVGGNKDKKEDKKSHHNNIREPTNRVIDAQLVSNSPKAYPSRHATTCSTTKESRGRVAGGGKVIFLSYGFFAVFFCFEVAVWGYWVFCSVRKQQKWSAR